jgi:Phage integrase family
MVTGSVQKKTNERYRKIFAEWNDFVDKFLLHKDLDTDCYLSGLTEPLQVECVLAFLAHLYYDQGLAPNTISNYLSGIRYNFQLRSASHSFMDKMTTQRFLKGALLNDAVLGVHRDKKSPMPLEMIMEINRKFLKENTVEDAPYRIAIFMAYFFLLRQSEYIYHNTSNDHALRVEDVEYRMKDGVFVTSHMLRASKYGIKQIDLVKITLRHCKNDPFRLGNAFWFSRREVDGFDLVKELATFSYQSYCQDGDVFTSCRYGADRSCISRVTYVKVQKLLRQIALEHNLDPKVFGTHSFRIGGATALAAGNVGIDLIQRIGGWKSDITPMQYTQPSSGAFAKAHDVLMNEKSFTKQDLLLQIRTKDKRMQDCASINDQGRSNKPFLPLFVCTREEDEE